MINVKSYTEFKIVGRTRDDAAGEALDKAARTMGLNYPGGLNLDKIAKDGNRAAYKFPRPRVDGCELDFSFSGLKTSVINLIHNAKQKGEELPLADLGASFLNAVVTCLTDNTEKAVKQLGHKKVVLAGGVSANSMLRSDMKNLCNKNGWELYCPELKYCGDNAAMVGAQAFYEAQNKTFADTSLNAYATMPIDNCQY